MRPRSVLTSARWAAAGAVLAIALGACAGGSAAGEEATEFVHIHGLAIDPTQSNVLWVATHRGLIRGADDSSWTYASEDRNDHMGFTLDPTSGTLFRSGHPEAGGTLGVQSSSDGRAWQTLSDVLSPPADFHAMTLSFADPTVLYGWDSGGRGFFRSADGGRTWEKLQPSGLDPVVVSLAAPASPGVVFAATPSGLFRTGDAAGSWNLVAPLGTGPVTAVAADPGDPDHLLAFTGNGMNASRDGGATWLPSSGGIPPGEVIGSIAISPHDEDVAYAAGTTSIYKTTDGGDSWSVVRSGP